MHLPCISPNLPCISPISPPHLQLDFGLADEHAPLLNLPSLPSIAALEGGGGAGRRLDKRQLQVEVSNWINEFDQRNVVDSITRAKVEQLGLGTLTLTLTLTQP